MKKSWKKVLARIYGILVFIFVLIVFVFSLYKVVNYIKTTKIIGAWAISFQLPLPSSPPLPPEPPCPPPCPPPRPPGCPTPTPTPSPPPEPTPPPEVTPTPPPEVTPTPTPVSEPIPTLTSPPPSEEGNGAVGGPGPAPVCGASIPDIPTLTSVTPAGTGEVELVWSAVDLATHYSISYGLSSGDYLYGVDNTGNVTSFTVGGLDPAATYCFAVRAVHDCAPSGLSNEICTGEVLGAAVGQVLGVTTLADTGSATEELFYVLFIIGSVCLGVGLKLFLPVKKLA